ncbi:MAG TPA: PEP-CTERM sorting domain-containing protein [Stellaceae bacterium]|nr:PEP-CTERM sorting domain-containing protein [Stellaceae bacterium]
MGKVWLSLLAMLLVGPSAGPVLVGLEGLTADVSAAGTETETIAAATQGGSLDTVGDANPAGLDVAGSGEGSVDGTLLQLALEGAGKNGDLVTNYGDCNYGGSDDYDRDCNRVVGNPGVGSLPFLVTGSGGAVGGAGQIGIQGVPGYGTNGWIGGSDWGGGPGTGDGGFRDPGSSLALGSSGSVDGDPAGGGNPNPPAPPSGPTSPGISDCLICGPRPGPGPIVTPGAKPPVAPLITGPTVASPPIDFDLNPVDPGNDNPTGGHPLNPDSVPEPQSLLLFGIGLAYLTWLRRRHSAGRPFAWRAAKTG